MPVIENGAMRLTRRDISALAKAIKGETGIPHAKSIAIIARGLGFEDGNALMGSLKTSGRPAEAAPANPLVPTPAPEGSQAGYLYTLTFPFISDDPGLQNLSLGDIAHEVTEGGAVGAWGEHYNISRIPVSRADLGRLATIFGSTPDFFGETDPENIEEAMPGLNLYSVRVPRSLADSEYIVAAHTADAAAAIYVSEVIGDIISVDLEGMAEAGELYVDTIGSGIEGKSRIIYWGSEESITRDMKPGRKTTIRLDRPDWLDFIKKEGLV